MFGQTFGTGRSVQSRSWYPLVLPTREYTGPLLGGPHTTTGGGWGGGGLLGTTPVATEISCLTRSFWSLFVSVVAVETLEGTKTYSFSSLFPTLLSEVLCFLFRGAHVS